MFGCALFLSWLAIGRFGFQVMMAGRAVAWFLIAASSTASVVWAWKLPAMIPEMQDAAAPDLEVMTVNATN